MLACELTLTGIDVAIVEKRVSPAIVGSRAGGLHSRTIEVLDQRGIADRFLSEGQVAQVTGFAAAKLDISDLPTRHPYGLGLWQNHIERILASRADELDVTIYRGSAVSDFEQDDIGVDMKLSNGQSLRAEYLVGCDGGRSLVRKKVGIEFPGWESTTSSLIAEVEMTEQPPMGTHHTPLESTPSADWNMRSVMARLSIRTKGRYAFWYPNSMSAERLASPPRANLAPR